jgi:hypothetical protein
MAKNWKISIGSEAVCVKKTALRNDVKCRTGLYPHMNEVFALNEELFHAFRFMHILNAPLQMFMLLYAKCNIARYVLTPSLLSEKNALSSRGGPVLSLAVLRSGELVNVL